MRGIVLGLLLAGAAEAQPVAELNTLAAVARIEALNPAVNAVAGLVPGVVEEARAMDRRRMVRGPLYGVAVLEKDNIEVKGLPTTAGSMVLAENDTGRDAPLVARLRAAGAVVLGDQSPGRAG
jgi:amidase